MRTRLRWYRRTDGDRSDPASLSWGRLAAGRDRKTRKRPEARAGAALLVAMVCLALAVLLLGPALRLSLSHQRQVHHELSRWQADWLAEAALERAVDRLHQDPDYSGETWEFLPEDLGPGGDGQVTIRVSTSAEDPDARRVSVQARYPLAAPHGATCSKQVQVHLSRGPG